MRTIPFIILVGLTVAGCTKKRAGWTPELVAAVREARASLTNFTDNLESSQSNLAFSQVCAVFHSKTGRGSELVWANVWQYDGASFSGAVVGAQPSLGLTNNEAVAIPQTNVVDWMYLSRTGLVGRFLDRARP